MLRITRETDYAILMLSQMAASQEGAVHSVRELADRSGISMPMASKILKPLARNGVLRSHRGSRGGYSLVRRSEDLSLGQIVEILEGPLRLTDCVDKGKSCERDQICPARKGWRQINEKFLEVLESTPLSQMAAVSRRDT